MTYSIDFSLYYASSEVGNSLPEGATPGSVSGQPIHAMRDRDEILRQRTIFCTECGVQLENFCFSQGLDNVEALKKNLAQCKKDGKFAGEFCSKLFIADPENQSFFGENED